MALDAFIAALVIGLSEIADKTQLVILALALRYRRPWPVFFGALTAHIVMDAAAVGLGWWAGDVFPRGTVSTVVGVAFIVLGCWMLAKRYIVRSRKERKPALGSNPFVASLLLILASEFGDKTQIASALLGAEYLAPLQVILGMSFALAIAIGANIFIGSKVAERLPRTGIKVAIAILFIAFGVVQILTSRS